MGQRLMERQPLVSGIPTEGFLYCFGRVGGFARLPSPIKKAAPKSGSIGSIVAPDYPINLRRSTPARPSMPEPNSTRLLGSGVESLVPINVKASEGIEPTVLS